MLLKIEGNMGSGKTASMVHWMVEYLEQVGHGSVAVWTNFEFKYSDLYKPAEYLLLHPFKDDEQWVQYSDVLIGLDELWTIIDSRNSTSGYNDFQNNVILRSRKRFCHIIGTAQLESMFDKRFRGIADTGIQCDFIGEQWNRDSWIENYVYEHNFKSKEGWAVDIRTFQVSEVCDLYNTSEEIERDSFLWLECMSELVKTSYPRIMKKLANCPTFSSRLDVLGFHLGIRQDWREQLLFEINPEWCVRSR